MSASDSSAAKPSASLDPQQAIQRGMLLALHAQTAPDRPALISDAGSRTYGELNARANQLVRALRARGVKAGDSVALICSNRPEFVEVMYAALRSGMRITPINWHLGLKEISYIVDNCEAVAVVADGGFAAVIQQAVQGLARARVRLAVGGSIDGFEHYDQAIETQPGDDIEDPELGTHMLYTSGTTGNP